MRVKEHPVLGQLEEPEAKQVTITFDGRKLMALEGEPIAAALLANGIKKFRYSSKRKEPRGLFCGIGQCTDCVMEVDGVPNVRTCVTPVRDGMRVNTQNGGSTGEIE